MQNIELLLQQTLNPNIFRTEPKRVITQYFSFLKIEGKINKTNKEVRLDQNEGMLWCAYFVKLSKIKFRHIFWRSDLYCELWYKMYKELGTCFRMQNLFHSYKYLKTILSKQLLTFHGELMTIVWLFSKLELMKNTIIVREPVCGSIFFKQTPNQMPRTRFWK